MYVMFVLYVILWYDYVHKRVKKKEGINILDIKKYEYSKHNCFDISKVSTSETGEFKNKQEAMDEFYANLDKITGLQAKLYAERKEGVIFVFQAMDAAGKDGVIRTVFERLTPHGVKEFCFKAPTAEELTHDYLWRFNKALPAKGNISIFNRSYYEDVLIGKVHKLYENQPMPDRMKKSDIIKQRYKQINAYENYLYSTGTRVVKIFLNVSKDEQARRFVSRIDVKKKNWKISKGDISEREYWDEYQQAFEDMVNATSSKDCPWYVVPADNKWYERLIVSRIVLHTLEKMDPHFPTISKDELADVMSYRESLVSSITDKRVLKLMKKDAKKDKTNQTEEVATYPAAIAGAKPIVVSGVDLGQDK